MKTYQITYNDGNTEQIEAATAAIQGGMLHFYHHGPFRGISLASIQEYREVERKSLRQEWIDRLKNPNLNPEGMSMAQKINWDMVQEWIQNNKKNSTND